MSEKINNNVENTKDVFERLGQKTFAEWNESLQSKNPEVVAGKYNEEGELFGTVSNKIRHGRQEIAEYFQHFLAGSPVGELKTSKIIPIDSKTFLMGGEYVFELDDKEGGRKKVTADYTFVWQKEADGQWRILHHHSAAKSDKEITVDKDLLIKDTADYQKGLEKKLGGNFFLKTFFFKDKNDGLEKRVTRLYQTTEDEDGNRAAELIYQQVSEKPDNSSGV